MLGAKVAKPSLEKTVSQVLKAFAFDVPHELIPRRLIDQEYEDDIPEEEEVTLHNMVEVLAHQGLHPWPMLRMSELFASSAIVGNDFADEL